MGDEMHKIELLEQRVSRQPNNTDALHELGVAYLVHGVNNNAIDCFKRVVSIIPDSADAHCYLGWALLHIGKINEAGQEYGEACKLVPGYPRAVSGEADVLYRLGELESAYNRIRSILDAGLVDSELGKIITAARIYAKICNQFGDCEEALRLLVRMAQNADINISGRVSVGYALGGLFDRQNRYEEAFESYQNANNLINTHYSHEVECIRNDLIINAFSKDSLSKINKSSNKSRRPVFIIGMPRSGTSLIEQILNKHPDIYGAGELSTITEIANVLAEKCDYPDTLSNLDINVLNKGANHYLHVIGSMSSSAKRVTDKMPANFMHLGLIYLMFPNAQVIHACRNPLDICLSIFFQSFGSTHAYATDLRNIGMYYNEYMRLMSHWKNILNIDIHEVQYEHLVNNQEDVSRSIVEYCGLEWNENCMKFYDTDRVVTTASHDQVNKKIYTKSINRWKNYEPYIGALKDVLNIENSGV